MDQPCTPVERLPHFEPRFCPWPDCAEHTRTTLYLTVIWRNFLEGRSERKPDPTTPAMRLGLAREPWTWPRVLSRRLFPAREPLTEIETTLYRREWTTPVLPSNQRHTLRHAY